MPHGGHCRAMRTMLGLNIRTVAKRAGIEPDTLLAFERGEGDAYWQARSQRLHSSLDELGAFWRDPELHQGVFSVGLKTGTVDDKRAIRTVLALLPSTPKTLAKKAARFVAIDPAGIRKALAGRAPLHPAIARACFRALGSDPLGAGCWFVAGDTGGWREVGCPSLGAAW
jgi:transcriptional regulator with XRE-family HTH domain